MSEMPPQITGSPSRSTPCDPRRQPPTRHKGAGVAVFATARQLARLVYRMLRFGHEYVDIGESAYEEQYRVRWLASLKESARSLGFTLQEVASG